MGYLLALRKFKKFGTAKYLFRSPATCFKSPAFMLKTTMINYKAVNM